MSRSGYSDGYENWQQIMWRGAVKSAFRGRRGQMFMREMLEALDALPEKRLVDGVLEADGSVCALGAVGRARGLDMGKIDPENHDVVAARFNVAHAMACEIMYENDDGGYGGGETPELRWSRMRAWVASKIRN